MKRYMLEIYNPGSFRDVWVYFESDTPFQAISKGDIIHPGMFPDASAQTMLRVTSIEHIIWALENKQAKHKICVYTEDIEDDAKARFGFDAW